MWRLKLKLWRFFGKKNWGGFWRFSAKKGALSDLELLSTLFTKFKIKFKSQNPKAWKEKLKLEIPHHDVNKEASRGHWELFGVTENVSAT